ncbi:MAG: ATP-binding cassette domain-containing protein [Chitinophagaceae bacterium]
MIHTLEADSIQLQFNGRTILSDIYLSATTGEITGLLGRNGQGKSCLMRIIYGSLSCEKSIRIDKIQQNEAYKQRGLILYLPQFNFIPKRLSLKRIFTDFELTYDFFQQRFPAFAAKYNTSAGSLSGGELRLVEVYLIVKSACLFALLDEPFTHLNPVQTEKVKDLLTEEKLYKGLLITDHMYRHVTGVCDILYILSNGKLHLAKSEQDIERHGYARL